MRGLPVDTGSRGAEPQCGVARTGYTNIEKYVNGLLDGSYP